MNNSIIELYKLYYLIQILKLKFDKASMTLLNQAFDTNKGICYFVCGD